MSVPPAARVATTVPSRTPTRAARTPAKASDSTVVPGRLADLRELLKPGISVFVTVTAAAGYLLGATVLEPAAFSALLAGTFLTAGGSGALNHVIERRRDRLMARTQDRPVASGRMSPAAAVAYGLVVLASGLALLAGFVDGLTAGLAALTAVLYVGVYTPLKPRTPLNTLVGAVPGALPILGGYAAATGRLDAPGWALFAILFLWQLPHFFALAWMCREDYARAGFRMLPVVEPDGRSTGRQALWSTLALLVAGVVPAALHTAGPVYLIGMIALGTAFALPAFSFYEAPSMASARRLLLASIVYVPVFFGLVVLDQLLF